jgi:hypothetical protein
LFGEIGSDLWPILAKNPLSVNGTIEALLFLRVFSESTKKREPDDAGRVPVDRGMIPDPYPPHMSVR